MALPRALSAKYKTDFAYPTVKDRIPVILTKVIDTVYRLKSDASELHGQAGLEDMRLINAQLSQLKHQITTDKPIIPFTDTLSDTEMWNAYLSLEQRKHGTGDGSIPPSWFQSSWLYVECYFYRRIISAISLSHHLKDLDPFRGQKRLAFTESSNAIDTLIAYLLLNTDPPPPLLSLSLPNNETSQSVASTPPASLTPPPPSLASPRVTLEKLFDQFLHLSLWGNKCDLSISAGAANHQNVDALVQLDRLSTYLLHDDTKRVWEHIMRLQRVQVTSAVTIKAAHSGDGLGGVDLLDNTRHKRRVDIVLDNAGFELVSDLCFADMLITCDLVDIVYFHAKTIPWFVSDVTLDDWEWTLSQLAHTSLTAPSPISGIRNVPGGTCNSSLSAIPALSSCSSLEELDSIGQRFRNRVSANQWIITTHDFWTLPHDFTAMITVAPDLYASLSESDLIVFKGDLNYRKLTGDLKWPIDTEFRTSLRGFCPAPLVALRTLKCDLVVGVELGKSERAAADSKDWMLTGSYGVIQFDDCGVVE